MNDILLNKKIGIERSVKQIREYYALNPDVLFEQDYLKQDAIAINLQRLCEACIDIANHWIRRKKLGLPQDSADAFALLHRAGALSEDMSRALKGMVGFRNVLIHEYKKLDLAIMRDVIEHHLHEPLDFANLALQAL